MDLHTAQNLFAIRLYDWSFKDFLRELEEGCPLMSSVGLNNRRIAAYVAWNETLPLKDRHSLARALTRRCHENAVSLKGEHITQDDKRWHKTAHEQTSIHMEQLPPLATADKTDPAFRPIDPDHCLDALLNYVTPVLGKASRRKSGVICRRWIGDWKILTEFTFRRKHKQLVFEYQFIRKDGGPVTTGHPAQGPFPRTLFLFYGVYETSVFIISMADSEPMAKVMEQLAEYFLLQAEPLFAGLGIAD